MTALLCALEINSLFDSCLIYESNCFESPRNWKNWIDTMNAKVTKMKMKFVVREEFLVARFRLLALLKSL